MFTMPLAANTNSATTFQQEQQADSALQNRFPGWTFIDGQYYSNGKPHKLLVQDRSGGEWTVWFNANDQITQVLPGNQ